MKFKVGDRVRLVKRVQIAPAHMNINFIGSGSCGSVEEIGAKYYVLFDEGSSSKEDGSLITRKFLCDPEWLEPESKETRWFLQDPKFFDRCYQSANYHRVMHGMDWGFSPPMFIKPKKTIMEAISLIAKKILDADLKTLIKAGYMTSDLVLTQDGRYALEAILFTANKAALVEAANEKLAEEKK